MDFNLTALKNMVTAGPESSKIMNLITMAGIASANHSEKCHCVVCLISWSIVADTAESPHGPFRLEEINEARKILLMPEIPMKGEDHAT